MEIPDEKKEPFAYKRWKDMDLLNASDVERILMLELESTVTFKEYIHGESLWNRMDMREFVRDVSRKIEKKFPDNKN